MSRGQQALTKILPSSLSTNTANKGHRNVFQDQRDEALAARFYYHSHICRLRYDDCLVNLEKEFFITNLYISQRLTSRSELVKQLVDKKANKRSLKKQYPHYDWN